MNNTRVSGYFTELYIQLPGILLGQLLEFQICVHGWNKVREVLDKFLGRCASISLTNINQLLWTELYSSELKNLGGV